MMDGGSNTSSGGMMGGGMMGCGMSGGGMMQSSMLKRESETQRIREPEIRKCVHKLASRRARIEDHGTSRAWQKHFWIV